MSALVAQPLKGRLIFPSSFNQVNEPTHYFVPTLPKNFLKIFRRSTRNNNKTNAGAITSKNIEI